MKEEIKKFFRGEVEDGEETLAKYSRDASIFEVRPQLVLFPMDAEDVKNLVRWVAQNKSKYPELSITSRCAGTDMGGGAIGESLILDFTRHMNRLIGGPLPISEGGKKAKRFKNYPLVPSSITVEPGMFYRDFEKITLAKGLILPSYTASKSLNAIGGMYGNNSAGEKTLKYGQTERYILEAKVVFADGNEYTVKPLSKKELEAKMGENSFEGRIYWGIFNLINEHKEEIRRAKPDVRKNSSGYYAWNVMDLKKEDPAAANFFDLNKLLVGSQGTLGIATEITLKLLPATKHSKLVAIFMNDLEPLGRLVDEILALDPETLETYDDKTMKLAVRFFPDFLKNKGLLGMLRFMWSFLPEFLMIFPGLFGGGFPKLVILAEFTGDDEKVIDRQCAELKARIKNFKLKVHITRSEAEADKYWDIRRQSFALLRKHVQGKHTAPFIDDIIVQPKFLPKFLPELNEILSKYDLIFTLAGHAGDGNFHIIPLMDFKRPDAAKIVLELSDKVYDLVIRYRGSITAEHNDGIIRTPYLEKMYGREVTGIFAQIKNIFDPKNIFNPGKKVPAKGGASGQPGTKAYIASHIAIEHASEHKS